MIRHWKYAGDMVMLRTMETAPLTNIAEFTVSELSSAIKRTMEDAFGLVRLRGEISGYRGPHGSGHAYLCLKDDRAKIDGVIWRQTLSGLRFKPEEGLEVIVTGRITTFPGKSSYQIVIEKLEPAGAGALMALLEERKKRFAAEGLFDEARKKPLPFWPQIVGIVTSPTGAVIRDMLHGFEERCPTRVILWPARVQGETCCSEVAAAIRGFNALRASSRVPRPDLVIVARGGGSLEDLWGFNDEDVVRAAAESEIPLISAVGHETDWTLIDLVADARAPTPTKAAEWAVPKYADLVQRVEEASQRGRRCIRRSLERASVEFRSASRGLPRPASLLAVPRQRLDSMASALAGALRHATQHARSRCERTAARLNVRLIETRIERCSEKLLVLERNARFAVLRAIHDRKRRSDSTSARLNPLVLAHPQARRRERLDSVGTRLTHAQAAGLNVKRGHVASASKLLRSLSHASVMDRGFALVRDRSGHLLPRKRKLDATSSELQIEFADGRIRVHTLRQDNSDAITDRKALAAALRRSAPIKKDTGGQGSLL